MGSSKNRSLDTSHVSVVTLGDERVEVKDSSNTSNYIDSKSRSNDDVRIIIGNHLQSVSGGSSNGSVKSGRLQKHSDGSEDAVSVTTNNSQDSNKENRHEAPVIEEEQIVLRKKRNEPKSNHVVS